MDVTSLDGRIDMALSHVRLQSNCCSGSNRSRSGLLLLLEDVFKYPFNGLFLLTSAIISIIIITVLIIDRVELPFFVFIFGLSPVFVSSADKESLLCTAFHRLSRQNVEIFPIFKFALDSLLA